MIAIPKPGTKVAERPSLSVLKRDYDIVHGSREVSLAFMSNFIYRKQQIGQLELLAALVPYLSAPEVFRGKRVMHWIDNTSAVAGIAKGYSGVPDSARIVHATHATLAGLGASVWFEYVRSKANVADVPSREDLSDEPWDCDLPGEGLVSNPIPVVMPEQRDWAREAGEWVRSSR